MSVIEVNHVTKEYRLGQLASFKDNLIAMLARLRGQHAPERKPFKALDDIDFKVEQGEVVGIIGQNGAGKSTLLKILSSVVQPTSGSIKVMGKIAPLIEVGAGLVGDLTGRENIFLNSSILGIPRAAIKKKLDEIVSFAELEEFIDTPVKRYSSGMMIRLGFSIATSIDADILIVDEVLAVGDLAFQRKCFSRMEELIKGRGNTVLLVSHNIRQIERMCSKVILFDHGKILANGTPKDVCNLFYERSNDKIYQNSIKEKVSSQRITSSGEMEVESIELLNDHGESIHKIPSGGALHIKIKVKFNNPIIKPEFVIGTHTTDFVYLTANSTTVCENQPDFSQGIHTIECKIPSYPMAPGVYCVRLAVFDQHRRILYTGETLRIFTVRPSEDEALQPPMRIINVPALWKLQGEL